MLNQLEKTFPISPSHCDSSARLGIPNSFALFMDIATEHADILGIGLKHLSPQHRFWLTVKSKAHFYRRPSLSEVITLSTWPEHPDSRKCNRDYTIRSGDELLIDGKTEWAVIDTSTGRLIHVDTIYPEGLVLLDDIVFEEPFSKFTMDLSDARPIGNIQVRSTDIDLGGHMNNVAYINAFASLFSSDQWNSMDIHEMEVWYRSQCYENEVLSVVEKKVDDATEVYYIKVDQSIAFELRYL
ncbi:MAG: hypothetical protein IJ091_06890 [Oscillospiraceae bacterium]|nr:hypothetical protein [Oscillospiraceae bacterium]